MGCFLACFGSSKKQKRRKQPHNASRADPNFSSHYEPITQSSPVSKQDDLEKPISLILGSVVKPEEEELSLSNRVKSEEQLSSGTRKKVTFDSNVRTYEHVSVVEAPEILSQREKEDEKGIIGSSAKPSRLQSVSENGSAVSSLCSYPTNHRYQNCRESDDEDEELDEEESDLDDEDDKNDDQGLYEDYDDEYHHEDMGQERSAGLFSSMESRTKTSGRRMVTDELNYTMDCATREGGINSSTPEGNARDRSRYIHPVLNPVENVTQWKAVKTRRTPPLKQQKENFTFQEEPCMPFINDQRSKQQSKLDDGFKNKNVEEISVAASLSTWLVSSQKTPSKKVNATDLEARLSETSASSHGSNSQRSGDRPFFGVGAITADELKQFSSSSSPKRSPSQSKDHMLVVGNVGAHLHSTSPVKDSGLASSFKGIPNTTSKYREDKRVNWHSTPFEMRLDRALNSKDAAKAYSPCRIH
ncbi:hypothetical protein Ancab_019718 [Ancistrocladus abbreviatus]